MRPIRRAAFAYVVYFAGIGAGFPYLPVHYRELGFDLAAIGAITAVNAAVQLVGGPIWGALADRFHRSRVTLPAAALVAAGGAVVLAQARTFPEVVAAAALLAVGTSGVSPVLDARTLEILGPAQRIRYGQLRAWGSVSFIGVAIGVGLLIDRLGVPALFLVYVPALVLTALVTFSLPRMGDVRAGNAFRGAGRLLRGGELAPFLGAVLVVFLAFNAVTWFYSIQLVALGGSGSAIGLVWSVGAIVEVPIMFGFPRLAARFGSSRLMVVGAALFALRALLSAAATEPWMLIAISPLEGIAYGLFFVGGVERVARRAPAGMAATAQGLYAATGGIASIVGSAVGGAIADASSIPTLFALSGILGIGGIAVLAYAVRGGDAPSTGSLEVPAVSPG